MKTGITRRTMRRFTPLALLAMCGACDGGGTEPPPPAPAQFAVLRGYTVHIVAEDGEELSALETPGILVHQAIWSPDGRTLAVIGPPGVICQKHQCPISTLYTVDPATGAITRLTDSLHVADAAWSPDGSSLAFVAAPDGTHASKYHKRLFRVSAAGGSPTRISDVEGMLTALTWGPAGAQLTVSEWLPTIREKTVSALHSIDPVTGAADTLATVDIFVRSMARSPTDPLLLLDAEIVESPLYMLHLETGTVQPLPVPDEVGGVTPRVSWSTDGQRLAFSGTLEREPSPRRRYVFLMNGDGTGARMLPAEGSSPTWRPCTDCR